MKTQATRVNPQQLQAEIERQRNGQKAHFSIRHPVADTILGAIFLGIVLFALVALYISQGVACQ